MYFGRTGKFTTFVDKKTRRCQFRYFFQRPKWAYDEHLEWYNHLQKLLLPSGSPSERGIQYAAAYIDSYKLLKFTTYKNLGLKERKGERSVWADGDMEPDVKLIVTAFVFGNVFKKVPNRQEVLDLTGKKQIDSDKTIAHLLSYGRDQMKVYIESWKMGEGTFPKGIELKK